MNENKYKALNEWLLFYPQLNGWLYFNATNISQDNASLNSVVGDSVLTQFVDGSAEKELLFAIDMVKYYDAGTSDTNLLAIQEVENFSDWIEKQSADGNLPKFKGCIVNSVEMLQSAPSTSIDNEQGLMKYQFQGKVNYLDMNRKGVR